MATKRVKVSERNDAAVKAAAPARPVQGAQEPASPPTPAPTSTPPAEEATKASKEPAKGKARASLPEGADRLGTYLKKGEFDEARSAYLADWLAGGVADTFATWIAAALDAHAARTPAQRDTEAARIPDSPHAKGTPRTFVIPTGSLERMRAAIVEDQSAGRWLTQSAWSGEAINVATARAKERDGELPPPPRRLPNRLIR